MTKVINTERRTGRTSKLIGWVLLDPEHRTIVVHNAAEAQRVRRLVQGVNPTAPEHCVVSAGQCPIRGLKTSYAIDNAEYVLASMLGAPVDWIVVTAL